MNDRGIPVLLYDGTCGLCNAVVRFMLRRDRAQRLHFAPLQSPPAQAYLRSHGLPTDEFSSLVFVPQWGKADGVGPLLRTDGALAAVAELGGKWRKLAGVLRRFATPVRDAVYTLVARSRYALFGEYKPRPLPDPSWERRFLAH